MLLGAGKGSRDVSLISRWLLTTSFVMYGIPGKTRRDGPESAMILQVLSFLHRKLAVSSVGSLTDAHGAM
jgi:hypothetical protein